MDAASPEKRDQRQAAELRELLLLLKNAQFSLAVIERHLPCGAEWADVYNAVLDMRDFVFQQVKDSPCMQWGAGDKWLSRRAYLE